MTAELSPELQHQFQATKALVSAGDYEAATEKAIQLLEAAIAEKNGDELSSALGDIWYIYGRALQGLCLANSANLFGAGVLEEQSDDEWEDSTDQSEAAVQGDVGEVAEQEQQPEEHDDYESAWEALETARVIFDKMHRADPSSSEILLKLADTHMALGDLLMETEQFENAINDFRQGLEFKRALASKDPAMCREVAEAQYKIGVAYDCMEKYVEAADEVANARATLMDRTHVLEEQMAVPQIKDPKGKGKFVPYAEVDKDKIMSELDEVRSLLPDLDGKIEDLQAQVKLPAVAPKETIKEETGLPGLSVQQKAAVNVLMTKKRPNDGVQSPEKKVKQ